MDILEVFKFAENLKFTGKLIVVVSFRKTERNKIL